MEHLVPGNGYRTLERAKAKHAPEDAHRLARTRAIRSASVEMVMGISMNEPDGHAPPMPRRRTWIQAAREPGDHDMLAIRKLGPAWAVQRARLHHPLTLLSWLSAGQAAAGRAAP